MLVGILVNLIVFGGLAWQIRLVAIQVRQAREAAKHDHDRRRKQATLEFFSSSLQVERELMVDMPPVRLPDRIGPYVVEAIAEVESGDLSRGRKIDGMLGLYERLAVAVRTDIIDHEVLYRMMGTRMIAVYRNLLPWIIWIRDFYGEPDLYVELQWLASEYERRLAAGPPSGVLLVGEDHVSRL